MDHGHHVMPMLPATPEQLQALAATGMKLQELATLIEFQRRVAKKKKGGLENGIIESTKERLRRRNQEAGAVLEDAKKRLGGK